jgi:hypothetical protein
MKYEISDTCRLWLSKNRATILMRFSGGAMAVSWFAIAFFVVFLLLILLKSTLHANMILLLFLVIVPLSIFFYKAEIEIDMEHRTFVRKNKIYKYCFKTTLFNWDDTCYFNYVVSYDNYKNISSISLKARYTDRPDSKTLIKFSDPESFFKFQKLFNKKFHDFQILEWYS